MSMDPKWLAWARQIQAIAQNGLAYSKDPYDIERFEQLRGLAAEITADHTDADRPFIADLFAGEAGYATPKLDVRGAVFRDGRILLVRERSDGLWTLPGGWVDIGDAPSEAIEREVREESGYRVKARKLLACYDRNRHPHPPMAFHVYKLCFLCELVGGSSAVSLETDGVGFFARDRLPALSTGRVVAAQIERFFEHAQTPDLPTDFD